MLTNEKIAADPETTMRIISYDDSFRDQVIALVTGIQQQELAVGVTLDEQYDLKDISGTYLRGKGHFWLAVLNDTVIGTIGLIDLGNDTAVLKKMFVAKPYRGKGKAVGQRLLEKLMHFAQSRGFRHIYLGTGATLHAAHRFYERNGFHDVTGQDMPPAVLATFVKVDTKRYYKAV